MDPHLNRMIIIKTIGRMEASKLSRLQLCHVRTVPARLESARFPGDPNAYLMIRLKPSFDET